jgi:hypothetical protein
MAGSAAAIVLTAAEYHRLTSWCELALRPNVSFVWHGWTWSLQTFSWRR